MLPGRRSVLKGAALLGGGALVGAGTADRASAQASGQVGTSSDPVDVEAYDLAVQNQLSSNLDAGGNDLTNVGSLNTDDLDIGASDFLSPGAFIGTGPSVTANPAHGLSTTSSSYVSSADYARVRLVWDDDWRDSDTQGAVLTNARWGGAGTGDLRYRNTIDGENVFEQTGLSGGTNINRIDNYTPTTTSNTITLQPEIKSTDGNTVLLNSANVDHGVQV